MDKRSYALGMSIAHNMIQSGVKDLTLEDFLSGLSAILAGQTPEIPFDEAGAILDEYFTAIENEKKSEQKEIASAMKAEGKKFLLENASKEGVVTLPSGLQYRVIREGKGKKPTRSSKVYCNYEGKFINGQIFDSSYKRGEPIEFGVTQVIAGWTEVLQLMSEGAEWEVFIPYNLAYGENGAPGAIPPCATLIFRIELIEVR